MTIVILTKPPLDLSRQQDYARYHGVSVERAVAELYTARVERERRASGRPPVLTYGGLATG